MACCDMGRRIQFDGIQALGAKIEKHYLVNKHMCEDGYNLKGYFSLGKELELRPREIERDIAARST